MNEQNRESLWRFMDEKFDQKAIEELLAEDLDYSKELDFVQKMDVALRQAIMVSAPQGFSQRIMEKVATKNTSALNIKWLHRIAAAGIFALVGGFFLIYQLGQGHLTGQSNNSSPSYWMEALRTNHEISYQFYLILASLNFVGLLLFWLDRRLAGRFSRWN